MIIDLDTELQGVKAQLTTGITIIDVPDAETKIYAWAKLTNLGFDWKENWPLGSSDSNESQYELLKNPNTNQTVILRVNPYYRENEECQKANTTESPTLDRP